MKKSSNKLLPHTMLRKRLPDTPGIYFFLGRNKKILYIGRATSLRSRVRSYFTDDIAEKRSEWIATMLTEAQSIDFRRTDSVLEAILLEADLIKKFQPLYNTDEKDDKSFNCVIITKEDFPAVFLERSKNIDFSSLQVKPARRSLGTDGDKKLRILAVYGPFPHGLRLQDAMKIIRKIFPYRDTKCQPLQGRPCFNRQIGLCPGTCTGETGKREYAKSIRNLKLFFEGKKARLLLLLNKEMNALAKVQRFEQAHEVKRTIFALQHIQDVALLRSANYPVPSASFRIEAYDLSHFGGKDIVGAMTVIEAGETKKSEYRLFKLRSIQDANETKGLQEILTRRLEHGEWTKPDIIVVDGNDIQMNAARTVLHKRHLSIPLVAVVKDNQHKPKTILGDDVLVEKYKSQILLANNEAHRFALSFQKKKRKHF